MARPRKPEAERRTRTIGVRVTTAEAAEIAERAAAARMTKGGYMRRRALGQPVREAAVHRLGARERVELHRIGVNLNQIARALNSWASAPPGTLEAIERVGELAAGLLSGESLAAATPSTAARPRCSGLLTRSFVCLHWLGDPPASGRVRRHRVDGWPVAHAPPLPSCRRPRHRQERHSHSSKDIGEQSRPDIGGGHHDHERDNPLRAFARDHGHRRRLVPCKSAGRPSLADGVQAVVAGVVRTYG